jgi:hypothetical protein
MTTTTTTSRRLPLSVYVERWLLALLVLAGIGIVIGAVGIPYALQGAATALDFLARVCAHLAGSVRAL